MSNGAWGAMAAALLLAWCAACGKGPGGGAKKIPREGDAQAVVVVEAPGTQEVSFSDEAEPNNAPDQANALAPGTGVRGSLDGETDVDLYRLTVKQAGVLGVRLGGIEAVDLVLELRDREGQVVVRSDRGPAGTVEGIPNLGVAPGEYHLAVREFVKKRRRGKKRGKQPEGRVGPSPVYELVARLEPGPALHHEAEPNSSADQATEVLIGDEVFGYMGWHQDVDMWKLSVEGFSADYGLDLDIDGVPGVTLELTLLDHHGTAVLARQGHKDGGLSVRNLVVVSRQSGEAGSKAGNRPAADPPRHYYARLRARRSNPVDKYRLRMATRLMELDEENEPNDDPDSAIALRDVAGAGVTQGTRRGYLTVGDMDHYRVTAGNEPVLLMLSARPGTDTAELGLELEVSVAGQVVARASGRKQGGEQSLADVRIEAGKTAIIKLAGKGGLATDAAYALRWSVEPAAGAPLDDPDDGLDDEVDVLDEYETE